MKSAGVAFANNSSIDSQAARLQSDPSVIPFDRAMEDFSHNCDVLFYELVGILFIGRHIVFVSAKVDSIKVCLEKLLVKVSLPSEAT